MRCSIIIPIKTSSEFKFEILEKLDKALNFKFECLLVTDALDEKFKINKKINRLKNCKVKCVVNEFGPTPANAIKYGIGIAKSNVLVVTMADGSDDPFTVPLLINLVERGVSVACGSRYMPGGQQVGARRFKKFLSSLAGKSIKLITGVGTHDSTNNFKAYSSEFIKLVGIDSSIGFEIGIELVAKAIRIGALVAEVPTVWIEHSRDRSNNFKLFKWLPHYLNWYLYAIGINIFSKKIFLERKSIIN